MPITNQRPAYSQASSFHRELPYDLMHCVSSFLNSPQQAAIRASCKEYTSLPITNIDFRGCSEKDLPLWLQQLKRHQSTITHLELTPKALFALKNLQGVQAFTKLHTVVFHGEYQVQEISPLLDRVKKTASIHFESKFPYKSHFLRKISEKGFSNLSVRSISFTCPIVVYTWDKHLKDFQFITKKYKGIQSIYLDHYTKTDVLLEAIAENCKSLTSLNLSSCERITEESLKAIAQNCKDLSRRNLTLCKHIADEDLKALAENCKGLKHLSLAWCAKVTNEGIKAITASCKELTHLYLDNCYKVTDEILKAIATNCKELTRLNLVNCYKVTDEGIKTTFANCKKLTTLYH